jgi:glycosyltransferase involved in cell wall biosynthesis
MTVPARLAVHLLPLLPGGVGGTEEYVVRTLSAFARHGPDDIVPVLFVLSSMPDAHPDLCETFETVVCPIDGTNRPLRIAAESTWLANHTQGFAVVHHLGGRRPVATARPAVVTVHDLQPLDHPDWFSPAKRAFLGWSLPRTLRSADVVVVLSEMVSRQVVDRFGVDPDRVVVVPCGTDHRADSPAEPSRAPVILYPAVTHPHKNHSTLIEAFARVAGRHPDASLVFTGAPGSADAEVRAAAEASGIGHRITFTGRIPAADLATLMAGATVMAYPSRYEGFGIPVLEAMAAGVPAVVAAGTAAADLATSAGVVLEPDDVAGWAEEIDLLIADTGYRSQVARSGLVRASNYTWEASARQLERAWRIALEVPATGPDAADAA